MKKKYYYIILYLVFSFLVSIFSIFSKTEAGTLRITPSSGTLVQWCSYPFEVHLNTLPNDTLAVDTKIFLSGFDFHSAENFTMDHNRILTGKSTDLPTIWKEYFYLNSYQNFGNTVSGWDIQLWLFNFIVKTGSQYSGSLKFYYIGSGINSDDSNITNGFQSNGNKATQYQDTLSLVIWGEYNFVTQWHCRPISTIISWNYYQTTYQNSGYDFTDYLSIITAWYDFDYPNLYNWDSAYDSRVYDTGRTTRTNTAVVLVITGDLWFKIEESSISGFPISVVDNFNYSISKTLIITWNIDDIPLTRSTSWNIYDQFAYTGAGGVDTGIFYIDVFWIDNKLPELTWIIQYYTGSFAYVTLSGYTNWVNRSTIDDQYKILNFSGIFSAPTDYLTSSNNIFSLQHKLDFASTWSGDIIYIDRAGNTGSFFLDLPALNDYIVRAYPQWRLVTSHTPNPNLATIGEVVIYDENYLRIATGTVTTNNYGTGFLSLEEPLSWYYFVTFNWLAHLQSVISGTIIINNENRLIDFTDWNLTRSNWPIKDDILSFQTEYLNISANNFSDIRFDELFYGFKFDEWFDFIESASGTEILSWVQRDNILLNTTQTWKIEFTASIKDDTVTWFNRNPSLDIYSWTENITNSGYLQITSWTQITSVEIAWELVKDTTINAVDASVIIDYILTHGATNSNSEFGYIAEDLNANWQVDTADITIWWYNLMRRWTSFP